MYAAAILQCQPVSQHIDSKHIRKPCFVKKKCQGGFPGCEKSTSLDFSMLAFDLCWHRRPLFILTFNIPAQEQGPPPSELLNRCAIHSIVNKKKAFVVGI